MEPSPLVAATAATGTESGVLQDTATNGKKQNQSKGIRRGLRRSEEEWEAKRQALLERRMAEIVMGTPGFASSKAAAIPSCHATAATATTSGDQSSDFFRQKDHRKIPTQPASLTGVTTIPDDYWKEEMENVQPAAPPSNTSATNSNVEYDSQGRRTKSSLLQDTALAGRVGAFPQAGPGLAPRSETDSDDEDEGGVEIDEQSNMDGDAVPQAGPMEAHVTPIETSTATFWTRKPFMARAVLLFLIVVVAVVIRLVISWRTGVDSMSNKGTNPPTTTPSVYIAPIPNLSNTTLADIDVPFTIPNQAYQFVTQDPNWNSYEDWRRQQRFAMACIFYVLGGSMGGFENKIDSHFYNQHECEWNTSFKRRCPGGNEGIVKVIEVSYNTFVKGYIPPEVALLPHLEAVSIRSSWLVDMEQILPLDVPNTLPSLKELSIVDCGDNNQGTIPSKLGLLTSLTKLDLSNNKLGSTIPSELGLLSNLTSLVLVDNLLTGTIPEEIGHLTSLVNFEADGNSALEPFIPSGFCSTNHTDEWNSMTTDWCSGPTECCANS